MDYIQIFNIIGAIVILFGVLPIYFVVLYSLAKDGFIKTFKKLKNFNNLNN